MGAADMEPPADLLDPDRISHEDVETLSPIRMPLWDKAGWIGAAYMWDLGNEGSPALGLMFRDEEAAREIFASWRADFGEVDDRRSLRVVAVRGIDAKHPAHYRLVVAPNLSAYSGQKTVVVMQRIHTMTPDTTFNLDSFLEAYEAHGRFLLVPAFMRNGRPEPDFRPAIGMYGFAARDAWQIGLNDPDGSGVMDGDDVIVPPGVENPPVRHLQAWKRRRQE